MAILIHTISGAPRPWRVLLGLAFKGLAWEMRLLSASDGDLRSDAFLSINPRGTVPVLESGDVLLRDSIACLAWLDRAYPKPPLFGKTAAASAQIWQQTMETCDYLRDASHELLSRAFSSTPPAKGSDKYSKLEAGADAMHFECKRLNKALEDRPFLSGSQPSAADAVTFPELRLVQRAVETKHELMSELGFGEPSSLYPALAKWKIRVEEYPGVWETMPPHWS